MLSLMVPRRLLDEAAELQSSVRALEAAFDRAVAESWGALLADAGAEPPLLATGDPAPARPASVVRSEWASPLLDRLRP